MIGTALLAMILGLAQADPAPVISESEKRFYSADFEGATRGLDRALALPGLDPDTRLALLLQKLRVLQNARLAGVTLGDEVDVRQQVLLLTATTQDQDLAGQAALRLTVSRYFTALLGGQASRSTELIPIFESAAQRITTPCRRAEALFFAGLMPQVAGKVPESKAPLEAAGAAAGEACPLEQSYVDRHLAAVALAARDIPAARALAAKSTALRRQVGFEVFLPFSLMLDAEVEDQAGNRAKVQALLLEAAALAARLELPGAKEESCAQLARRKLSSEHCPA